MAALGTFRVLRPASFTLSMVYRLKLAHIRHSTTYRTAYHIGRPTAQDEALSPY